MKTINLTLTMAQQTALSLLRECRDTAITLERLAKEAGVKVTAVHVDLRTMTTEWYTVDAPAGGGLVYQDEVTQ